MHVRSTEPGFVRVSHRPDLPGIRMTIDQLIIGLAHRGKIKA